LILTPFKITGLPNLLYNSIKRFAKITRMGNILFHWKDQQVAAEIGWFLFEDLDGDGYSVHGV
jgi:hypothetical protein